MHLGIRLTAAHPAAGMGGGFTKLDPESRRVVPDAKGRRVIKVVYTVLESQYQSSITEAVKNINATNDKVCYEIIGYLLEELRDDKNFTNFEKDLQDANIFIGSLIFIEELAEKVCLSSLCLLLLAQVHPEDQCLTGLSGPCFVPQVAERW